MMNQNFLTRLYSGTVYRFFQSGRKKTTKTEQPNWAGREQVPEEELEELLSSIKERVYTLKTTVHEQSREIEEDLADIEQIVLPDDEQEDNL